MVGTIEEALVRRRQPDPESLYEVDKDIIGQTCRLEIPFRDVHRMKQAADLLRGFAAELEFYAQRDDLPARTILFHLATQARALNKKLRDTRGAGRPRRGEHDA